jgi:hypothetical protein
MRIPAIAGLIAITLAVAHPGNAGAQTEASTFGAEVFGAFNTYAMGDVNDAVDVLNFSGGNFDKIKSGITGGLGARWWPSQTLLTSLVWEPLFAKTKSGADEVKADGNSFQLSGTYFFPTTPHYSEHTTFTTATRFGVGGGVGYYNLGGETFLGGVRSDINGNGFGFHIMGLADCNMSPGFAVTGGLGWRFAGIGIDNSTNDSKVDYSGLMLRVGVAFYLPGTSGVSGHTARMQTQSL